MTQPCRCFAYCGVVTAQWPVFPSWLSNYGNLSFPSARSLASLTGCCHGLHTGGVPVSEGVPCNCPLNAWPQQHQWRADGTLSPHPDRTGLPAFSWSPVGSQGGRSESILRISKGTPAKQTMSFLLFFMSLTGHSHHHHGSEQIKITLKKARFAISAIVPKDIHPLGRSSVKGHPVTFPKTTSCQN